MKNIKWKIGDVAMLIGTSKEAIRYFEKQGYIPPQKKDEETYRRYTVNQAGALRWLKMYRSYGFSLDEAAELIHTKDVENQREMLGQGVERIEQQMRWLRQVQQDLKDMIEEHQNAEAQLDVPQIVQRPAFYRMELDYDGQFTARPRMTSVLKPWYDHMPLVKSTPLWYAKDVENHVYRLSSGLGIFEGQALDWNPADTPGVEYYPASLCITVLCHTPRESEHCDRDFDLLRNFAKEQGLRLCGDIISRPVALFYPGQREEYYHRFFWPVEKVEK